MLFILSGPSGCGKSTLARKTLAQLKGLEFSVSHTTRRRRKNEEDNKDYHFVTKDEFEALIKAGKMVEWAEVHGCFYGTSYKELEKKGAGFDLLLDIDVQGARQIQGRVKKAVFIFILPPSFSELKRRLIDRGENSPEEIRNRLEIAKKEIRQYPQFDYVIINENMESAIEELKSIVISTRCMLSMRQKKIQPIIQSFSEEEAG
ncbi:MAG: guanylate kinase [Candidatus Aminicenantes bacterium]|nr:guanylate kinase [Candidatus Aminicenantes bacterium]